MEKDLVSIITANYNSENYITDTIESVINQTFQNWELIIVDDCSKDNSMSIVEGYRMTDKRIKVVYLGINNGPAATRNAGIAKAAGRYITFIDSDDLWEPDYIKTAVDLLSNKNIDFVFSSYYRRNENLTIDNGTFIVPDKVDYTDLLKTCSISCLTAMYDSHKLEKTYMPDILKRQDYGLWLNLLKKTDYAYGIQKPLATYRMRDGSVSRNKIKAAQYQWKIYREVEKLNFLKSSYYFVHYAINGYLKYKT